MKAYDFEYDGVSLSDFGFVICKFGSKGLETNSNGSYITFNKVSTMRGSKHELTSFEYDDCLGATIQICKNTCMTNTEKVSVEETRKIMRWLNRKGFHKFKLLDMEYTNIYFEASFNVSKIEIDGYVYGFELEVVTNRPYAISEPVSITINNTSTNGVKNIISASDQEGYVYPEMEIVISNDGDFELYNESENRVMRIANCKAGEVINVNYPMITTSLQSHKIQNDFNWIFFRIANSFRDNVNKVTISIPCNIKMKYYPIVKVGI